MFIFGFRKRRLHDRSGLEKKVAIWRQTLEERGTMLIAEWRKISMPTTAVLDQIWEFFYEYTQCMVSQILLDGSVKPLTEEGSKALVATLISILYPQKDYVAEIFARLRFIAEQAFAADKPGNHDCYSPLDTPESFRRMLGVHLWDCDEIVRKLKPCREDYAAKVRNVLRQVEFEQSRYDSWEMLYLECERRYHQILNRIGESTRPVGPAIYSPRSPWELHALIRDLTEMQETPVRAKGSRCNWKTFQQLRTAVFSGVLITPEDIADQAAGDIDPKPSRG